MITPSPTTKIDPKLARGVLVARTDATATKPAMVTLAIPNTSYELHLVAVGTPIAKPTKRSIGRISARARRIDVVTTGGQYIEPVMGRPRRVQGTVIAMEGSAIVVDAGVPIHCTPNDPRQKSGDFLPGDLVSFDVLDGATFEERSPTGS